MVSMAMVLPHSNETQTYPKETILIVRENVYIQNSETIIIGNKYILERNFHKMLSK